MPSTVEQRRALLAAYPPVSENKKSAWVKRVEAMSDTQVHAIYTRLLKQGKIK